MRNEQHELIKLLRERAAHVAEWLQKENPQRFKEQRNLDPSSPDRIHWHFGYLAALNDVVELLVQSGRA
jgi:hypothetical protein